MHADNPGDIFAVKIPAGHHHDSAFSPKPAGGENFAMPEGVNEPLAPFPGGFPVLPTVDFPSQAAPYQEHGQVSDPTGKANLHPLS
jgi:hypothetical protein